MDDKEERGAPVRAGALCYSSPIAKLWPEWVVGQVDLVDKPRVVAVVVRVGVRAVLVKEPAVLAFTVRIPLALGKLPMFRPHPRWKLS